MKALLSMLPLLMLLGCSSDWSTSPNTDAPEAAAVYTLEEVNITSPLTDIEPPQLPCETNHTGFLALVNPANAPVTFRWGASNSVQLLPRTKTMLEVPMGAQSVQWCPSTHAHYEEFALVPLCETITLTFDPLRPCRQTADQ